MTDSLSAKLPDDIEQLARDVLKYACDHGMTVATAESCTGGLISALLTDVEGTSHAFERGFGTYTNEAKCEMLGVLPALIDQYSAVSAEVADAMAKGALEHSRANAVVAVTGYAGAAGPDGEPGLCFFAAARRNGPWSERETHFGDVGRGAVREGACRTALEMLDEVLKA